MAPSAQSLPKSLRIALTSFIVIWLIMAAFPFIWTVWGSLPCARVAGGRGALLLPEPRRRAALCPAAFPRPLCCCHTLRLCPPGWQGLY